MAKPSSSDSRLFHRCARQRYDEAKVLFEAERNTGAVYLAGYSIECILKSLILAASPPVKRTGIIKTFRGVKAHDYDWLRSYYLKKGGAQFPRDVTRHFASVNVWSTELRYLPREVRAHEAQEFLKSALAILRWGEGRL